jgi:hypothetical protein
MARSEVGQHEHRTDGLRTFASVIQGFDRYFLPYNQWDWLPADPACRLRRFDRKAMCSILTHLNASEVLFVGDSTSDTHAQSFLLLMGGPSVFHW